VLFCWVVELRVVVLRYVVEKQLSGFFVEVEIALIISREAVIEDHIVVFALAESYEVWRAFELLIHHAACMMQGGSDCGLDCRRG
jgi:hypothetical protein